MCRCHAGLAFGGLFVVGPLAALEPAKLAGFLVAWLMSAAVHESAHGGSAYLLGDPTAMLQGRVTLNPIPHIDPIGTLLLPILMFVSTTSFGFGWAKPTPINPFHFRNPVAGMVLSAAAGPVSNVVLAVLFALVVGLVARTPEFTQNAGYEMLETFVAVNVGLAVFNLLPVPPLDGSKVVAGVLSPSAREAYLRLDVAGLFIVLILSYSGMLQAILHPPIDFLMNLMGRIASAVVGG